MANKEQVVEAVLSINLRLRQFEESLSNLLNALNVNIDVEKTTDTALIEAQPITSIEGFTQLNLRLDDIEASIHALVPDVALACAADIVQYKTLLQIKRKN